MEVDVSKESISLFLSMVVCFDAVCFSVFKVEYPFRGVSTKEGGSLEAFEAFVILASPSSPSPFLFLVSLPSSCGFGLGRNTRDGDGDDVCCDILPDYVGVENSPKSCSRSSKKHQSRFGQAGSDLYTLGSHLTSNCCLLNQLMQS